MSKKILLAVAAIGAGATAAHAGGVERSNQSVGVLFEEGRYLEFGFSTASPDVSGNLFGAFDSGDMTESFVNFGAAYKADLNDQWSYAVILNQPWGADIAYPAGTGYPFAGSNASLKSNALTGIVQYNLPSNVSFYGGLRAQSLEANALVNIPPGEETPAIQYTAAGDRDYRFGYLVGAAYERPDIALRVSLTYNSEIKHKLETSETAVPLFEGALNSTTEVSTPQSLHLEFQTGIAADTLLFGGVRWVEWTKFDISPAFYSTPQPGGLGLGPLVSYADDRITWTLGLGRRLNDQWSIAGSLGYEETTGSLTGNLSPTDGFLSASLAAVYTQDNTKVTAGVSYFDIGDATTNLFGSPGAKFTGNDALGFGVKVGYSF